MRTSLSTLAILAACACNGNGNGGDFTPAAKEIVMHHAKSALEAFCDRVNDKEPLGKFLETTADAKTRADLAQAWDAIPALKAKRERFLESRVFEKATKDKSWPAEDLDEKAVFVDGTRDAVTDFLKGEG